MILKVILSLLIFLFSCGTWANPFPFLVQGEQEKGVGDWKEVPFGKMRIVSCSSGVQDLSVVVGGLQVQIDPDWILKKPTLKPLSDKLPSWIESPVRPGTGKNTIYQKEVLFPLIYARNPTETTPFELGVQGGFTACREEKCLDIPIRIGMDLTADESEYTSLCNYIIEKQVQSPLPAETQGVEGYAWKDDQGISLLFTCIYGATTAFLQTPGQDDFQITETQFLKKGVFMRAQIEPWAVGTTKNWILVSDKGVFNVPVIMQDKAVLLPRDLNLSWKDWLSGWELFFFTPLFIWWGLGLVKTKKLWKKQIIKMGKFLPLFFVLWVIISKLGQNFISEWIIYYGIVLFGFVCLFPPQKWYLALGLFLIWPSSVKVPELSLGLFFLWGAVVLSEMVIPFAFLYLKADEIGKILREYKKKNFFFWNLVFLLPTVIMLGSFIFRACQKDIYQNALNSDGLSVVCSFRECDSWRKMENVSFINSKDIQGLVLREIYPDIYPLVVWQDKYGRFVLPSDVSVEKAKEAILNWKTYHAQYKP